MLRRLLRDHGRLLALTFLVIAASTVSNAVGTNMPVYAGATLGLSETAATAVPIALGLASVVFPLLGGWLADRYGRRPVMIWPRAAILVLAVPAFLWLLQSPGPAAVYAVTFLLSALSSINAAAIIVGIPESLPRSVRSTGLSLVYALSVSIFGGSTNFLINWLVTATGDRLAPAYYLAAFSLVGTIAAMMLPETRGRDLDAEVAPASACGPRPNEATGAPGLGGHACVRHEWGRRGAEGGGAMSEIVGETGRPEAVAALLSEMLADPEAAWSLGSFGAIAEFVRDPDEDWAALFGGRLGLATGRGAIALTPIPDLRPLAYETAFSSGWNHAIALCLPERNCAMAGRTVVTELGPDEAAARPEDRPGILFDLGLGLRAVEACVRTADPETLACLRAGLGQPLFAPGNPAAARLVASSPHRVFVTRIGRIEVFTPIRGRGEPVRRAPILTSCRNSSRRGGPMPPPRRFRPASSPAGRSTRPIPTRTPGPAHPVPAGEVRRVPAPPRPLGRAGSGRRQAAAEAGSEVPPEPGARRRDLQSARRAAEVQAAFLRGETPAPALLDETDEERGHA